MYIISLETYITYNVNLNEKFQIGRSDRAHRYITHNDVEQRGFLLIGKIEQAKQFSTADDCISIIESESFCQYIREILEFELGIIHKVDINEAKKAAAGAKLEFKIIQLNYHVIDTKIV